MGGLWKSFILVESVVALATDVALIFILEASGEILYGLIAGGVVLFILACFMAWRI